MASTRHTTISTGENLRMVMLLRKAFLSFSEGFVVSMLFKLFVITSIKNLIAEAAKLAENNTVQSPPVHSKACFDLLVKLLTFIEVFIILV
jgi:hypothetical protein